MYFLYFALWVIFNGKITLEIAVFGVIIAAAVFAFTCRFMGYSIKKERFYICNSVAFVRYVLVLVLEIIKANFAVMHMILSEREEIEPALISFHCDMGSEVWQALLANAITLTPGTITVTLEHNDYVVHCLDMSLADGIDDSSFVHMLRDMEGIEKEA